MYAYMYTCVWYMYIVVCVHMCVEVLWCMCVWRPEDDTGCLSVFSTCAFETGTFVEPRAQGLGCLAGEARGSLLSLFSHGFPRVTEHKPLKPVLLGSSNQDSGHRDLTASTSAPSHLPVSFLEVF